MIRAFAVLLLLSRASPRPPGIRIHGSLREVMHGGDRGARTTLEGFGAQAHGVGALAGLAGEITIVDGETVIAVPDGKGGVVVERTRASGAGAALLAVIDVTDWRPIPVANDVAATELDAWLGETLAAAGVNLAGAVPMRIEGRFLALAWHVVDGQSLTEGAGHDAHATSGAHGVLDEANGTLVGFYSRHHAGVLTHMGQATHLHFVAPPPGISGHVDAVGLSAGSVVLVPR
jgi:acetolactate decarboxylase